MTEMERYIKFLFKQQTIIKMISTNDRCAMLTSYTEIKRCSFHNINPLSNFYILARYFKVLNEFLLPEQRPNSRRRLKLTILEMPPAAELEI